MSFFGFNQKKNAFDELLYFIRRKSNLILKIEKQENDNTVLKITQKADHHGLRVHSRDIQEVLVRVDNYNKDFIQVNFKNRQPILITEKFIGFNPLGAKIDGLPEIVTTVDLKEVYKVTFELIHLQSTETKENHQIPWEEVQKLKDMFFAIAAGGIAAGFQLQREKEEFQYLMISRQQAVSA